MRELLPSLWLWGALFCVNLCCAQGSARMDQIVRYYTTERQFMGSVLVACGPDVLFSRGYGSANADWSVPNDPQTKFRIGSLTKQFTAAAILLLEERGKLKVTDPIDLYLPDAPVTWRKITLLNLLTHTSGIPDFTDDSDCRLLDMSRSTPEVLTRRFHDKPLAFEPGTKWAYSNSGYVLLGRIIERVSGQHYSDFLQHNLFGPLGMTATAVDSAPEIVPRRAVGYERTSKGLRTARIMDMSNRFAAGNLVSTTEDLLRWQLGLFGGQVLSNTSLRKMTSPGLNHYGMGLFVQTADGRKIIYHSGGVAGFNTYMSFHPDRKISVIVLGNQNGAAPDKIGRLLDLIAEGQTVHLPSERTEIVVPTDVLQRCVGNYRLSDGWRFSVTREGNQLFLQGQGEPKRPIYPESETKFFRKGADVEFEFLRDGKQAVTGVILHQDGDFMGVRE